MASNYRIWIQQIAPPWLRGEWGTKYLSMLGELADLERDGAGFATAFRFLSKAPDDAVPLIAADSGPAQMPLPGYSGFLYGGMPRYPGETMASWRARIASRWETWPTAGTAIGVDAQLEAYISAIQSGVAPTITIWSHQLPGTPIQPDRWNRDVNPTEWSRFYVVIDQPHPWEQSLIGEGEIGDESLIGTTMTLTEVRALRRLVHEWRSAHSSGVTFILVYSGTIISPAAPAIGTPGDVIGGDSTELLIGNIVGYPLSGPQVVGGTIGYYNIPGEPAP